jgi:hypothetical protein
MRAIHAAKSEAKEGIYVEGTAYEIPLAIWEVAAQLAEHTELEIEIDRLRDELYHLKTEGE